MTCPAGTVSFAVVVNAPPRKAASVAAFAASSVSPTTFGTTVGAAPEETTRLTAEPFATDVPGTGVSLMTWPAGTVELAALLMAPTVRFTASMPARAAACARPTTSGTRTGAGPEDTTRFTADPVATDVPAAGVSLITWPAGTVSLALPGTP